MVPASTSPPWTRQWRTGSARAFPSRRTERLGGAMGELLPPAPRRLEAVTLRGPAGALEGLLQERGGFDHRWVAVVSHPHPLGGGTMHNKVVHRTAATLHELGAAVLRFNFRGVGRSQGHHDRGE